MRCGLAKSVTQAQLGTDESPTCEITADALRGSHCIGNVPVNRGVAGKSFTRSHFVNALSNLRQQRSCPESLQAIGAMATTCSMAGG